MDLAILVDGSPTGFHATTRHSETEEIWRFSSPTVQGTIPVTAGIHSLGFSATNDGHALALDNSRLNVVFVPATSDATTSCSDFDQSAGAPPAFGARGIDASGREGWSQ